MCVEKRPKIALCFKPSAERLAVLRGTPADTVKAGLDYVAAQLRFQSILACRQTQQVTRVVCCAPSFNFSSSFLFESSENSSRPLCFAETVKPLRISAKGCFFQCGMNE